MSMTRDGLTLWWTAAGALVAYLMADGRPPTLWSYHDWLKFACAIVGYGIGKLQTSPLPAAHDPQRVTLPVKES